MPEAPDLRVHEYGQICKYDRGVYTADINFSDVEGAILSNPGSVYYMFQTDGSLKSGTVSPSLVDIKRT